MPWFICDQCGDSIKKPSLQRHFSQCGGHCYTCIDCSLTFDRRTVLSHSTCVTEHEKYALGATKPGGFAAQGYKEGGSGAPNAAGDPTGLEFLSKKPPWKCSICNIGCTSLDTLMSHAAGLKHKRRARAATAAANGTAASSGGQQPEEASREQLPQQGTKRRAPSPSSSDSSSCEDSDEENTKGKKKKKKKAVVRPVAKKSSPVSDMPSSSSSSSDDDDSSSGDKKGARKSMELAAVTSFFGDEKKMKKVAAVVARKLSSKGKVGPKVLKRIAASKLGMTEEQLTSMAMRRLREKLVVESGVGKIDGKKIRSKLESD